MTGSRPKQVEIQTEVQIEVQPDAQTEVQNTDEQTPPICTRALFAGMTMVATIPGHIVYAICNANYGPDTDYNTKYGYPCYLMMAGNFVSVCLPEPTKYRVAYTGIIACATLLGDGAFYRLVGIPDWVAPIATTAIAATIAVAPHAISRLPKIIEYCSSAANRYNFWRRESNANRTSAFVNESSGEQRHLLSSNSR